MRHLKIKTGISKTEEVLLLFDDASGVLMGFYYLSEMGVAEEPKGIWLIDLNSVFPLQKSSDSLSHLIRNVCAN